MGCVNMYYTCADLRLLCFFVFEVYVYFCSSRSSGVLGCIRVAWLCFVKRHYVGMLGVRRAFVRHALLGTLCQARFCRLLECARFVHFVVRIIVVCALCHVSAAQRPLRFYHSSSYFLDMSSLWYTWMLAVLRLSSKAWSITLS